MQSDAVDLAVRDDADDDLLGAADHCVEERFPPLRRALLRIVEVSERTYLVVSETAVVEEHAGDDERPREAAATRLVGPGHEARAELAVEPQELRAGAGRHAREDSRLSGGLFGTSSAGSSETSLSATSVSAAASGCSAASGSSTA